MCKQLLTNSQVSEICRRYRAGESVSSLKRAFGVNHETICNRLIQSGIQLRTHQQQAELSGKLSTEQIAEVVGLYTSGSTTVEIAARFGITPQSVTYFLDKNNVPRRPLALARRKCTLNESALDSINEASAYWVGFLMADGNVYEVPSGSPRIKLELAACDAAHVERFREFLGATHKTQYFRRRFVPITKRGRGFVGDYKAGVSLSVSSAKLAESLARYGVTPRKSLTAKVIGLEGNRDYWRGMVDGDGCISASKSYVELIGSKDSMEQFASFVEAKTTHRRPKVVKIGTIYKVGVWGEQATQTLRVLYAGCSIALPRKSERAHRIIERADRTDAERSSIINKLLDKRRGVSIKTAAHQSGVSAATLSRIERGLVVPFGSTLARLESWVNS